MTVKTTFVDFSGLDVANTHENHEDDARRYGHLASIMADQSLRFDSQTLDGPYAVSAAAFARQAATHGRIALEMKEGE
jgi:hypothetical protein